MAAARSGPDHVPVRTRPGPTEYCHMNGPRGAEGIAHVAHLVGRYEPYPFS